MVNIKNCKFGKKLFFINYLENISIISLFFLILIIPPLPILALDRFPLDGETITDATPKLSWNAIKGATGYHLQVDNNADMSSPFIDDATLEDIEYTTSPLADGTYYWSFKGLPDGTWRDIWSFTISTALEPYELVPTLNSPSNGATITTETPTFDWSGLRGANTYHLQVADINDFSNLISDIITSNSEYTPSSSLIPDVFYWRVCAKNDSTIWGSWSSVWSFTLELPYGFIPTLQSPNDGTTLYSNTPEFNWTKPQKGAPDYHIQVSTDQSFVSLVIDNTNTGDPPYTHDSSLSDDTYYWRIRAQVDPYKWGSWSDYITFTINTNPSGPWDLTGSPIVIDDNGRTTGAMTWSEAVSEPWCSYINDTYVIENVIIDGQNSGNCITIKDSTEPFVISNCHVFNAGVGTYDAGIYLYNVNNGIITDCNISSNNNYGLIMYQYCSNNEISYNTLAHNVGNSIQIRTESNSNSFHHNTIFEGNGQGIRTYAYCQFNRFESNVIYNQTVGIFIHEGYNNTLWNNTLYYNQHGIYMRYSHENNITENNMTANTVYGLEIYSSRRLNVINNSIVNNVYDGIKVTGSSKNGTFSDNKILNNHRYGIFCDNANIANNTLFNNIFEENKVSNAYDNGTTNDWNGNFWDDYIEQLGVLAKDINDDWAGDSPYLLNGTSLSYDHEPKFWDPIVFTIITPTDLSPFNIIPPSFTLDIAEGIPESIWYSFDGGITKYVFSQDDLKVSLMIWETVADGDIVIDIILSDCEGIIVTDQVTLLKDATQPIITILDPSLDQEYGETPPSWEISIEDENFAKSCYSIDQGITNISCDLIGSVNADLWESIPEGPITIIFYANDTFNNVGSAQVSIHKNIVAPHILSNPDIIYPNGGESLSGGVIIQWSDSSDSYNHSITYSLYYTLDNISWLIIAENLPSFTCEYSWDTSSLPDGSTYSLLIVATCSEGLTAEDISDDTFTIISKPPTSSSTIDTSTTLQATESSVSSSETNENTSIAASTPFLHFMLLPISLFIVVLLKKRRF